MLNRLADGMLRYILLVPGGCAAALGFWQLDRRRWKMELLHERAALLNSEAVDVFEAQHAAQQHTYQPVVCRGTYAHDQSLYVGPRPKSFGGTAVKGWALITPLYDEQSKNAVLVRRGWVPDSWRSDDESRQQFEPNGVVTERGLITDSEHPSAFVPDNNPAKGEWYYIDAASMARTVGLPDDTPMVEVIAFDERAAPRGAAAGLPTAARRAVDMPADFPMTKGLGEFLSFAVMPSDHLNYALTWFALSGFTLTMAFRAMRAAR